MAAERIKAAGDCARHGFVPVAGGEVPQLTALLLTLPLLAMPQSPAFTLAPILTCGPGFSASFFGGKK